MQFNSQGIVLTNRLILMLMKIEQVDSNWARRALAKQYQVSPENLVMGPVWDIPEISKCLLMFEITDPDHSQFRSTVCFDITSLITGKDGIDGRDDLS